MGLINDFIGGKISTEPIVEKIQKDYNMHYNYKFNNRENPIFVIGRENYFKYLDNKPKIYNHDLEDLSIIDLLSYMFHIINGRKFNCENTLPSKF